MWLCNSYEMLKSHVFYILDSPTRGVCVSHVSVPAKVACFSMWIFVMLVLVDVSAVKC